MSIPNIQNARSCWNWFKKNSDLPDIAIAALLGNFQAESAFLPGNLENRVNVQLGLSDAEYCRMVNDGSYTRERFINDAAGFGLAQWTYGPRKAKLYDRIASKKMPIENLEAQCEYALYELKQLYPSVYNFIKTSSDLRMCVVNILRDYESPADQSENMKNTRTQYAQAIYDAFRENHVTEAEQLFAEIFDKLNALRSLIHGV